MDEVLGQIDIEGKSLTCSQGDIEKLTTSQGCELKMVTDKVHHLDDASCSDQEDCYDEEPSDLSEDAKLERMKREFISLTLNSNRDPVKPGFEPRLKSLFDEDNNREHKNEMVELANSDDGYSRLHKRYKNLFNFEIILKERGFEEISPGRLFKRITVAGYGPLITENSLVIYNTAFWNEKSAEPYDSTWLRHNAIVSDLSTDPILPGVRELILSMKNGEWCEAFIRPEAAFGKWGAPPRIPPEATIFCLLEVIKVVSKDKISMLSHNPRGAQEMGATFDDFFAASDGARMRGNHYMDQKQYKTALQRYKSGIRILEALTYKNEDEERRAKLLLLRLYNNSAKAANSVNMPRLALSLCKQALLIHDNEPKTYWHRLVAWRTKGHFDKALGTARQAMQIFKDDRQSFKAFQMEAEKLKKRIVLERADMDNLYRLMGQAAVAS